MNTSPAPRLLFLCTGNSCRSQMAEGWARHLFAQRFTVYSAGIEKHGLNPMAVRAMAEAGVDISTQTSRLIEELPFREFDLVITLCSHADRHCPSLPGTGRHLHHGFDDPSRLAAGIKDEAMAMAMEFYRKTCAEIREFVGQLPRLLAARPA